MKKIMRFSNLLLICICILFSSFAVPIVAHAEDDASVIEPRMVYIASYSTSLDISNTGLASVSGLVRGKSGVTSAYVKCTLQMSVGGGWVDVISWEDSVAGRDATVAVDYQLFSRGTYRVYMECRANNEEKTGTSANRTY